jgi:hypothetical protein
VFGDWLVCCQCDHLLPLLARLKSVIAVCSSANAVDIQACGAITRRHPQLHVSAQITRANQETGNICTVRELGIDVLTPTTHYLVGVVLKQPSSTKSTMSITAASTLLNLAVLRVIDLQLEAVPVGIHCC